VLAGEYSYDRDYAIFRVEPPPTASVAIDAATRATEGTPITIFGHPNGAPLRWSGTCTVHERMPNGSTDGASMFFYDCDTEAGNSGSTVLSANNGKVIGIHNSGLPGVTNIGTYLADTPIRDVLAGAPIVQRPVDDGPGWWSATVTPDMVMDGGGPFCNTMNVEMRGDAAKVVLDVGGTGIQPENLEATLAHDGTEVVAIPRNRLFPRNGTFAERLPVAGFRGDARGEWTICFRNFGTPATLGIWGVHD
jgi:hypothetical protein